MIYLFKHLKILGLCLDIAKVGNSALCLSFIELPDKTVALKRASGVGKRLLIVKNTIDKVIDLVLSLLGLIVEIPGDIAGILAGSNVGTHVVNEGHDAVVVLVLEEAVLGVNLEIVNVGGSACAPCAEVIAHSSACKLDNYVTCTLSLHPGSTYVSTHMESAYGLTEEAKHKVHVVTAVAEELTAAKTLNAAVLLGVLLGPDRHLHNLSVLATVKLLLELNYTSPIGNGVSNHKLEVFLFSKLDKLHALLLSVSEGLFHKHVLIVFKEEFTAGIVECVGKNYENCVNVRKHILIIFENVFSAVILLSLLGCLNINVAEAGNLTIFQLFKCLKMCVKSHSSATDNAKSELFVFHNKVPFNTILNKII